MSSVPVKAIFFYPYNKSMTGGPRVLINFMQRINRELIEPLVVMPSHNPLEEVLLEMNVRVRIIELPSILRQGDELALKYSIFEKLSSFSALLKYNREISKLIAEENVKLVWVRNIKGVLFTGIAARKMNNIPLIWDIGLEKESKGLVKVLHWLGLQLSSVIITEARSQQKSIFGNFLFNRYKNKIRTINPGISEESIATLKSSKATKPTGVFNILTAGSVGERKNQLMLIKAAEVLIRDYPFIHVDVVGPAADEAYYKKLQEYIQAKSLTKNVVMHGWRDDVAAFMGLAHVFVMCSQNEGIPYVIHEAMHAGLPVIVTEAGGMPDAVADGVTGFVIPKNSIEELVEKLKFLIENLNTASSMGLNAEKRAVEEFSASQWYLNYERLILELAHKA